MNWIVTNKNIDPGSAFNIFRTESFSVFNTGANTFQISDPPDYYLLIDGYVLPRAGISGGHQMINETLVSSLLKIYGFDFIKYIKGYFTIILFNKSGFRIYGDRLAQKKFFYSTNSGKFFFSNTIRLFPKDCFQSLNKFAVYNNCLFHHQIDGFTLFNKIRHNSIGSLFAYLDNNMQSSYYFHLRELLHSGRRAELHELTDVLQDVIGQALSLLKNSSSKEKGVHSITGGYDSRLILSALLSLDFRPDLYSYGPSVSRDMNIATKIMEQEKLNLIKLELPDYDVSGFKKDVDISIEVTGSLTSLFRTFRYFALNKLIQQSGYQIVTTGIMGGEGIRGYNYNNYYESGILKNAYEDKNLSIGVINEILKRYYIDTKDIDPDYYDYILNLPILNHRDKLIGHFHFIYEVIGSLHHTPDIAFITNGGPVVLSPFMDIDYLTVLFNSDFNLIDNKGLLKRHKYNLFYFRLLKSMYPGLLKIPMGNGIIPSAYLKISLFSYYDYFRSRNRVYKPTFAYDSWFKGYLFSHLKEIRTDIFGEILNKSALMNDLEIKNHSTVEQYWHRFASAIFSSIVYNQYNRTTS